MANAKTKKVAKRQDQTKGIEAILESFGDRAQKMIQRNRVEVQKAVQTVRKEVERRAGRAERAVRDVERKVLKQMHIATAEQVQRLERRLVRLERMAGA